MTVLILGAGTSLDYGYPSGLRLVDLIIENLEYENNEYSDGRLLRDLKQFKPYSIDSFLHKFPEHDAEAKSLIAKILFECEDPDKKISADKDLYRFLFHEISEEKYNQFKIISFNYDRSLEYYFSNALLPSKKNEEQAFKALDQLEIIHIHGRLPALPGEEKYKIEAEREQYSYGFGAQGYLPRDMYGNPISPNDPMAHFQQHEVSRRKSRIKRHGQQFKTVFQNHEEHLRAKEVLESASRVFFMGFGYHQLNLQLLGLDWKSPSKQQIFGTCFGMSPVRKAEVQNLAPQISLISCSNMGLFSDYYSLSNPNLIARKHDF